MEPGETPARPHAASPGFETRDGGGGVVGPTGRSAETSAVDNYFRKRIALRYWLLGRGYLAAAEAFELAESYHQGLRKDGITPEFSHQVAICSYLRTLEPHLRYPEETLVCGLLHDVREDYDVADGLIRNRFGGRVADAVDAMTKEFEGESRDHHALFERMSEDPIASIAKAADRIHNQGTMVGVFSVEKLADYIAETNDLFIPMLKRARRRFCDQEPAYENARLLLTSQAELVTALVGAQSNGAQSNGAGAR